MTDRALAIADRDDQVEALDPENVYTELLEHALECARCWPWRDMLWRAERLCADGRELVDLYAEACMQESKGVRSRLRVVEGRGA